MLGTKLFEHFPGFPFGIRATAQQFQRNDGYVPSGTTDMEGVGEGSGVTHFFIVSEQAVQQHGEHTREVLENTIKKAVIDYAAGHAMRSYSHFARDGRYQQQDLPVLYFFPMQHYAGDKYGGRFAHFRGQPTFLEAYSRDAMPCPTSGVSTITFKEHACIDWQARQHALSQNDSLAIDDQTARAYFEENDAGKVISFYNRMFELQSALGTAAVVKKNIRPDPAKIVPAIHGWEEFKSQFGSYYLLNFIYGAYRTAFYELCAEKMMEKAGILP